MKKVFLLVAATAITTAAFSQVRFGAQVIGNASSVSMQSEQLSNLTKPMQYAFGAGIVADIPLQHNFGVRTSLNFLQKKAGVEFTNEGVDGKKSTLKSTLNYLELPITLVYKVPVQGASFYFGAGPSFGYGLSGKMKYRGYMNADGDVQQVNETTDAFKKGDDGGALKRFDISANVNTGVQLKNGLFVNAGYLAGLSNLSSDGGKYKNRGLLLTVGVLIP